MALLYSFKLNQPNHEFLYFTGDAREQQQPPKARRPFSFKHTLLHAQQALQELSF